MDDLIYQSGVAVGCIENRNVVLFTRATIGAISSVARLQDKHLEDHINIDQPAPDAAGIRVCQCT